MNNSDETLEQPTQTNAILQAIAELSQKIDGLQSNMNTVQSDVNGLKSNMNRLQSDVNGLKSNMSSLQSDFSSFRQGTDAQLEAIRQGLVENNIAFDRLQSVVFNLRASVTELTEEVRHNRKVLV